MSTTGYAVTLPAGNFLTEDTFNGRPASAD
jgi:hypothetical protein